MFDLVRLIYTSRANFEVSEDSPDIEPEVAEILKEARTFNREANISGVLFFANGHFFQCLEGRSKKVLALVKKIEKDPRHSDLKVSFCRRARRRKFKNWTMKYVPVDEVVQEFVVANGYDRFDPTHFTETDINRLVELFTKVSDTSLVHSELRQSHQSKPSFWQKLFTTNHLRTV